MKLQPLGDRVVVKPDDEAESTTPSGLVIPDTAKDKPQTGVVIAVGPGKFEDGERTPMDVSEGDHVVFPEYGGSKFKLEGEELLVISVDSLLAVIA